MRNQALVKWETSARALPREPKLTQPVAVICGEAVDVAAFFARRYLARRTPSGEIDSPGSSEGEAGG